MSAFAWTRVPIADVRLRAYLALLVPCFIGHTLQLLNEDEPFRAESWARAAITPGWHLFLPAWVPAIVALGLLVSVVALAMRPSRASFFAVAGFYLLHYLTYPWRIRNHMTTMLGGLVVVSLVWLAARWLGALVPGRTSARRVDGMAVRGLAWVITVQYFFAGLHKMNPGFLDSSPTGLSPAVEGATNFWIYGDLGSVPPSWVLVVATIGTVAIELVVPSVARLVPRLAMLMIAVLCLFHVPHVAVMNVSDYPMIASAFYPALLSHRAALRVMRHLGPSRWTVSGALVGVGTQLWFMPYWGGLMVFGLFVLGLWGWALGAMLRTSLERWLGTR